MIRIREKMGDPQRVIDIADFFDLPVEFILETARRVRPGESFTEESEVDRWRIEQALDSGRIFGVLHAAASLGITQQSLRSAMDQLKDDVLPVPFGKINGQIQRMIFNEKMLNEWSMHFIRLVLGRAPVFSSLDHAARILVQALKVKEISAEIEYCSFEKRYWEKMGIDEENGAVASLICCLTGKPVSIAHAAWLDNGKPMSLKPDRISFEVLLNEPEYRPQVYAASLKNFEAFMEKLGK
jgi:hypothetical protein